MLKSFLYAVLKVYIYIRSDWYEPVTFFVYIESCISYYTKSSGRMRIRTNKNYVASVCFHFGHCWRRVAGVQQRAQRENVPRHILCSCNRRCWFDIDANKRSQFIKK